MSGSKIASRCVSPASPTRDAWSIDWSYLLTAVTDVTEVENFDRKLSRPASM